MSITTTSRHCLLVLLTAVSLGLAACGPAETIDAGAPANDLVNDESMNEEPTDDTAPEARETPEGFTPLLPRTDLIELVASEPEIMADPADDTRLLIHFEGAAEPCAGAAVSTVESDTSVSVVFQTGLDPNAAAMSCIAAVFDYEIVIQLDAPLGDRTIGVAN